MTLNFCTVYDSGEIKMGIATLILHYRQSNG